MSMVLHAVMSQDAANGMSSKVRPVDVEQVLLYANSSVWQSVRLPDLATCTQSPGNIPGLLALLLLGLCS